MVSTDGICVLLFTNLITVDIKVRFLKLKLVFLI
jgi:hypothetical protein